MPSRPPWIIKFALVPATDPADPTEVTCQFENCGKVMALAEAEKHARKEHFGEVIQIGHVTPAGGRPGLPWSHPDADILGDLQRAAQRARRPEQFYGQQIAVQPEQFLGSHSTPEAVRQDAEHVLARITGKHSTSEQARLDFLGLSGKYAKPTPLPSGDRPSRYPLIPVWVDLMGEMTPEEHAAAKAYEREQADLARRQRRERAVHRLQLPLIVLAGLRAIGIIVWTALT